MNIYKWMDVRSFVFVFLVETNMQSMVNGYF